MIAVDQNNTLKLGEPDFNHLWKILENVFYVFHLKEHTTYQREIITHSLYWKLF